MARRLAGSSWQQCVGGSDGWLVAEMAAGDSAASGRGRGNAAGSGIWTSARPLIIKPTPAHKGRGISPGSAMSSLFL